MLVELAMNFGFEFFAVRQQEGTQRHLQLNIADCNPQFPTGTEGMKTQNFPIPRMIEAEGLG